MKGNSVNVSTEVKKLKTEKDLIWRFEGNKLQFQFNLKIEDVTNQTLWALDNNKIDYVKESLNLEDLKVKTHGLRL